MTDNDSYDWLMYREDMKGKTEKVKTEDDVRGNETFESTVNCIQEVDEGRWVQYQ